MYRGASASSPRVFRNCAMARVNAFSVTATPGQISLKSSCLVTSVSGRCKRRITICSAFGSMWTGLPALNRRKAVGSTTRSSN